MDYATSNLNPALVAEAERLARQKADLKAQAEQAAQQLGIYQPAQMTESPGFQSAVTGTKVVMPSAKPSKWALAAPLAANAIRAVAQRGYESDVAKYENREAQAAREHLSAKPDDTASDQAKLIWAESGKQIPGLAPVMDAYLKDELIEAPARRAAASWERTKFDETRRHHNATENKPIAVPGVGIMDPATRQLIPGTAPPATVQFITDPTTGNVSAGNTKTGVVAPAPGGQGAGAKAAPVVQQELDAQSKVRNANQALSLLSDVDGLIGTATSSGMGTLRDQVYGFFGKSTPAGDAAGELENVAAKLLAFADKSGLGPQFSDADRKFLVSASSGGIGDPNVPESRKRAVLARIRRNLEEASGGTPAPSRSTSGPVTDEPTNRPPPTIVLPKDKATAAAIYQRLPDGAPYVDPNGVKRFKGRP